MIGAMASGRTTISNLGSGDDIHRTRLALEHLGVHIRTRPGGVVSVQGTANSGVVEPAVVLDCGNSGTTMRLLAGVIAGRPIHAILTGDSSLVRRPMGRIGAPLRAMGAIVDGRQGGTLAPLSVRGGDLVGLRHQLAVASAQVKSALLLAGLQADGVTSITEPHASRDHTERLLRAVGVEVAITGREVSVQRATPNAFDLVIPGDPSSAAFFVVGACITPGSELIIEDVCCNPTRLGFVEVLRRMGAQIEVELLGERCGEPVGNITVRSSELHATSIGGAEIPGVIDEIPVLAVAAAFAEGTTEISDAGELRVKESDRIGTIEQELSQLGINIATASDSIVISGGRPHCAFLKSHGDHRIGMAFAIAAHACEGESTVRGWRAVATSYPGFEGALETLAASG